MSIELDTRTHRVVARTTHGLSMHQRNWRECANDAPPPPRPFYRPEVTLGEVAFMVVVGLAIVGGMHAVVWLVKTIQTWMGA